MSDHRSGLASASLTNQEWLDRFLQYLRIEKGVAENTLQAYRHDLEMYRTYLAGRELAKVQPADVSGFLKFLYRRKLKPRSASRAFAAMRGLPIPAARERNGGESDRSRRTAALVEAAAPCFGFRGGRQVAGVAEYYDIQRASRSSDARSALCHRAAYLGTDWFNR